MGRPHNERCNNDSQVAQMTQYSVVKQSTTSKDPSGNAHTPLWGSHKAKLIPPRGPPFFSNHADWNHNTQLICNGSYHHRRRTRSNDRLICPSRDTWTRGVSGSVWRGPKPPCCRKHTLYLPPQSVFSHPFSIFRGNTTQLRERTLDQRSMERSRILAQGTPRSTTPIVDDLSVIHLFHAIDTCLPPDLGLPKHPGRKCSSIRANGDSNGIIRALIALEAARGHINGDDLLLDDMADTMRRVSLPTYQMGVLSDDRIIRSSASPAATAQEPFTALSSMQAIGPRGMEVHGFPKPSLSKRALWAVATNITTGLEKEGPNGAIEMTTSAIQSFTGFGKGFILNASCHDLGTSGIETDLRKVCFTLEQGPQCASKAIEFILYWQDSTTNPTMVHHGVRKVPRDGGQPDALMPAIPPAHFKMGNITGVGSPYQFTAEVSIAASAPSSHILRTLAGGEQIRCAIALVLEDLLEALRVAAMLTGEPAAAAQESSGATPMVGVETAQPAPANLAATTPATSSPSPPIGPSTPPSVPR